MKRTKYHRPVKMYYDKPPKKSSYLLPWLCIALFAAYGLLSVTSAKACEEIYLKVGAGYKIRSEMMLRHQGVSYHLEDESHPVSFRGELGCQSGRITYGVAKYSQWLQGWPVDNETETNRIEVFVDVKFTLCGS